MVDAEGLWDPGAPRLVSQGRWGLCCPDTPRTAAPARFERDQRDASMAALGGGGAPNGLDASARATPERVRRPRRQRATPCPAPDGVRCALERSEACAQSPARIIVRRLCNQRRTGGDSDKGGRALDARHGRPCQDGKPSVVHVRSTRPLRSFDPGFQIFVFFSVPFNSLPSSSHFARTVGKFKKKNPTDRYATTLSGARMMRPMFCEGTYVVEGNLLVVPLGW